MLTSTNRKGIRDSLIQWSQRRNIAEEVLNDFIELALSKANRALRIPPLESYGSFAVDENGYFGIPDNFIETKVMKVIINGNSISLERKSISEVDHIANQSSGSQPCVYGRLGDSFRIAPYGTVDQVEMYYYYAIPEMSADDSENWLTQHAPEVLLYGAMAELCSYTRDDEGEGRWNSKFNEAVNILQQVEDKAAWWSGDPVSISLKGSHS